MKLHSDFHDYYDYAIGYGVDEKVHYNRFTKKVDITLKSHTDRPRHHSAGILGFCGALIPFIQVSRFDKKRECDLDDDYDGKVVEEFCAFSFKEYEQKKADWYELSDDFISYYADNLDIKQFFFDWKLQSDEIFRQLECPVWMMRFYESSPNGVVNPRLKELGFDRIKEPVSAFQEISVYLSNILVEQKPVAEIDDRHRIEQHGFDLKTSFRTRKTKT